MFLRILRFAMVLSILAAAVVTVLAARAYVHLPGQAEQDVRELVEEILEGVGSDASYEFALVQKGRGDENYAEIWCVTVKYTGSIAGYNPETWTHVVAIKLADWQSPHYHVGFMLKSFFTKVGCSVS